MMEDVCILICIPQTSASRKLSLAAGRAIDADDGSTREPFPVSVSSRRREQPRCGHTYGTVTDGLFRWQIYELGPAKKGRRSGELANLLP